MVRLHGVILPDRGQVVAAITFTLGDLRVLDHAKVLCNVAALC